MHFPIAMDFPAPSHEWYLSFLDFRVFRFCRWHVYKRNFSREREKGRKESAVIYFILVGNCFQDLQQTVQSLDDEVSHKNDGAVTNFYSPSRCMLNTSGFFF